MLFLLLACATPNTGNTAAVGAVGAVETPPDPRIGLGYDVVLSEGVTTVPDSFDHLFDSLLETTVRFTIATLEDSTIRFDAAAVDAVIEAEPLVGEFEAPSFVTGPADLSVEAYGYTTVLYDTTWAGELAEDGSSISEGRLDGVLDTAPLAAAFNSDDPGVACDILAGLGATCEECPGGERMETCLTLSIEELGGARVE